MIAAFVLVLNLAAAHAAPATPNWPQLAERMTGESDRVREQCVRELRAIPNLESMLKVELRKPTQASRTRMYLALDVITTLKLHELLPDLIELSETEPSGYLYHAINTLVTPQNRSSLIALYRERVTSSRTSAAARMALIDTLARFGAVLRSSEMQTLFADRASDVRQTAMAYARTFLIRGQHAEYLALIKDQLQTGSFFLRVQAVYLMHELQKRTRLSLGAWQNICRGDASETVRKLCVSQSGGRR